MTPPAPMPVAAILVIGEEVLSGRVTDINSIYLSQGLRELGVAVRRVVVLPDDVARIAEELRYCAPRFDHVITTGGVGPTHDDVTLAGVALGLNRPQVRSAEMVQVIRDFYGNVASNEALRMADLPEGAELLFGEGVRFPVTRVANVWIFPGSPRLMRQKFEVVRPFLKSAPFFLEKLHLDTGEPEIAALLFEVQAAYPDVAIGSYPQEPGAAVPLILTIESKNRDGVERCVTALRQALAAHLIHPHEVG